MYLVKLATPDDQRHDYNILLRTEDLIEACVCYFNLLADSPEGEYSLVRKPS